MIFLLVRLFFHNEVSHWLIILESLSGIFFFFGMYFSLIPFYTVTYTNSTISNVPAYCSAPNTCTYVTENVATNTLSQERTSTFPGFYMGFFVAIVYALFILYSVITDFRRLLWISEEEARAADERSTFE